MKRYHLMILFSALLLMLAGCGKRVQPIALTVPWEFPEGRWTVGGVLYTGHVVDIQDLPDILAHSQDVVLELREDQTFQLSAAHSISGEVLSSPVSGKDLLMKPEEGLQKSCTGYLLTFMDPNTLLFELYYEGEDREDELPLIFIPENTDSEYIESRKGQPFHEPLCR